jgi:hypothetical protein
MTISFNELKAQETSTGFIVEVVDVDSASQVLRNNVTFDYIRSLEADTIKVKDKNNNPVPWIGVPLLSVIEGKTGVNFDQISKLVTIAPDGYNSVISNKLLPELKAAYLVYGLVDDNKWLKKYGQVRLIFENVREMYFVSNPEKIIVYKSSGKQTSGNIRYYFLGRGDLSGFKSGEDSSQVSMKIDDVLSKLTLSGSNFTLLTVDSFQREYFYNDITQQMELKIENDGTWKITGKKVPVGLRTRKIFYLQSEDIGVFLKSLSDEEITLWENYLHDQLPANSNFKFEIISPGDKRIPVKHSDESGIYKSMIAILDQHPEAVYVELIRR